MMMMMTEAELELFCVLPLIAGILTFDLLTLKPNQFVFV